MSTRKYKFGFVLQNLHNQQLFWSADKNNWTDWDNATHYTVRQAIRRGRAENVAADGEWREIFNITSRFVANWTIERKSGTYPWHVLADGRFERGCRTKNAAQMVINMLSPKTDINTWAKGLDLEVKHDLLSHRHLADRCCMWLQTFEDRSVGIFPVVLSPLFISKRQLVKWTNNNWLKVEKLLDLEDFTTSDAEHLIADLNTSGLTRKQLLRRFHRNGVIVDKKFAKFTTEQLRQALIMVMMVKKGK